MTRQFKVTATVEMVIEGDEQMAEDEDVAKMASTDILGGFFSTYPAYLSSDSIEEWPEIAGMTVTEV